jgi:hypothetical protein
LVALQILEGRARHLLDQPATKIYFLGHWVVCSHLDYRMSRLAKVVQRDAFDQLLQVSLEDVQMVREFFSSNAFEKAIFGSKASDVCMRPFRGAIRW